jgi:hypothetical protein
VTRAWWDTPWAALPAVALFGLEPEIPGIGRLPGLAPLAILVAVFFGIRHGRAALLPIALGTFPFWIVTSELGVRTTGGLWPAIVILFWTKFAINPNLRKRLLQREQLAWLHVLCFVMFAAFSVRAFNIIPFLLNNELRVDPSSMILTICVLYATSRMGRERVYLAGIICVGAGVFSDIFSSWFSLDYKHVIRVGQVEVALVDSNGLMAVGLLCFVSADWFRFVGGRRFTFSTVRANSIAAASYAWYIEFRRGLVPALVLIYASEAGAAFQFAVAASSFFAGASVFKKMGQFSTKLLALLTAITVVEVYFIAFALGDLFGFLKHPVLTDWVVFLVFAVFGHLVRREPDHMPAASQKSQERF